MSNVHDATYTTTSKDPGGEIRILGTRLDGLENRFDDSAACIDPSDTAPRPLPSLALRSDGKVLLAVEHVVGADISGRDRWEGIVLSEAEACDALDALSGAADDAAAHIVGHMLRRPSRP